MDTIKQLIEELGDNKTQVVLHLRILGIRGRRQMGACCPITKYLEFHGHRNLVTTTKLVVHSFTGHDEEAPCQQEPLPAFITEFIEEFDRGLYPDLATD